MIRSVHRKLLRVQKSHDYDDGILTIWYPSNVAMYSKIIDPRTG